MSQDDSDMTQLVRAARQADLPDAARLARVRARVLQPLAAHTTTSVPASSPKFISSLLGAKIVAGLAALGLMLWAYWSVQHSPSAVPTPIRIESSANLAPPVTVHVPESVAPAATDAGVQTEQPPERRALAPAPKRHPHNRARLQPSTEARSPVASGLAEEAALLRLATLAGRAGQLDRARALLADFASRYPNSQLSAERKRIELRLGQTVGQPSP